MIKLFGAVLLSLGLSQVALAKTIPNYKIYKILRLKMTDDTNGMSTESRISQHVALDPSGRTFLFPFRHVNGGKYGRGYLGEVMVDLDHDTQTDLGIQDPCLFATYSSDGNRLCTGSFEPYTIFEKDQSGKVLTTNQQYIERPKRPFDVDNKNVWFFDRTAILLDGNYILKTTLGADPQFKRIVTLDVAPLENVHGRAFVELLTNRANAALTTSGRFLSFGETDLSSNGFRALWTAVDTVQGKAITQRKVIKKDGFFAAQTTFGAEDSFLVLVGTEETRGSGEVEFMKINPSGKVLPLNWKASVKRAAFSQVYESGQSLGTYVLQAMPDHEHVIYYRPGRIEILEIATGNIAWAQDFEDDFENDFYGRHYMPWYSTISITPDQLRFIVTSLDESQCKNTPCVPNTKVRVFAAPEHK